MITQPEPEKNRSSRVVSLSHPKKSESGIERRPVEGVSDIKPRYREGAQAFELDSYFINLLKKFFVSAVREPAEKDPPTCRVNRRKLVLRSV